MTRRTPAQVLPPGEHLREELEARHLTPDHLAGMIGRPALWVNEFIAGKQALTPEIAATLAQALGTGAEVWLNLESGYRSSLPPKREIATGGRG